MEETEVNNFRLCTSVVTRQVAEIWTQEEGHENCVDILHYAVCLNCEMEENLFS